MDEIKPYRGRFAPTPSGPLHFGSLIAAVGSYLQARAHRGAWLVRIEDLDPPREPEGAADHILHTLEDYGFEWDGPVSYQSQRSSFYEDVLSQLRQQQRVYVCTCTRNELKRLREEQGLPPGFYPGVCRERHHSPEQRHALRLRMEESPIGFSDLRLGEHFELPGHLSGDIILKRSDGLYAYPLAVVVDDAEQGISEVVRGADLLDQTPAQRQLQSYLAYPAPYYLHLPLALAADGRKLSKQNGAPSLSPTAVVPTLLRVLQFLGQNPIDELQDARIEELWAWAIAHWDINKLPQALEARMTSEDTTRHE